MQSDRISMALTRIEAATLRITQAARAGRASGGGDGDGDGDADAKYEALRREAASALAELDQLIARIEP
jgi:hypothetical protein